MWQTWNSLEMLKLVFKVFIEYQDCHNDGLSVSVFGDLIMYVLTFAALDYQIRSRLLLRWIKDPIFMILQKTVNTSVIRMLFYSNNALTYEFICNWCSSRN